jgi:glycosyltransferase involved in cell wall biosynthesis
MKIGLMVSNQGPQAGGGFTYEDEIVQAICRLRGETTHDWFLIGYQQQRPAALDASGLPWISLHRSRSERRRQKWAAFRRLFRPRSRTESPDFARFPELRRHPVDLMCYLTPEVRPVADIPYLTTVWDLEHRKQPYFPEVSLKGEWTVRERRFREVLSRASYVLACNATGKQEVIALYGVHHERVRAFPQPTPAFALAAATEAPATVDHLGITGDYLFYPAQFWPHKNHVCLLEALKILRQRHGYRPQLVLTGSDKGNRAYLEDCARREGVADQVLFPGFVSRQDLAALYGRATALVYPTYFGPENLPPLEAFALGCPVIASDIPGHDEQLGAAAVLVDPRRPDLWAEEIERLRHDDAGRESRRALGRERAARYTPDHFARDLFKLLEEFAAYRRCWPAQPPV